MGEFLSKPESKGQQTGRPRNGRGGAGRKKGSEQKTLLGIGGRNFSVSLQNSWSGSERKKNNKTGDTARLSFAERHDQTAAPLRSLKVRAVFIASRSPVLPNHSLQACAVNTPRAQIKIFAP